jgi:hypothetical protein
MVAWRMRSSLTSDAAAPEFKGNTMSAHEFHVHGPHDHEVEHAALSGDPFSARIAVMTAIFATIGALFGYMVGATQNDALLFTNDSAIRKTEASDQWNFYQAKSSKQNLAELGGVLAGNADAARFKTEAERYSREKQEIMAKAQALEQRSTELEAKSEASMHVHHRWAQGMTLIQIAIALAAITLLTRSRWLQYVSYGAAAVSVGIGGLALLHV